MLKIDDVTEELNGHAHFLTPVRKRDGTMKAKKRLIKALGRNFQCLLAVFSDVNPSSVVAEHAAPRR